MAARNFLCACLCALTLQGVGAFRISLPAHAPTMRSGMSSVTREISPTTISRRGLFQAAAIGVAVLRAPHEAAAEFPKITSLTQSEIDGWVALDNGEGLRLNDISTGLGRNTKDGDR